MPTSGPDTRNHASHPHPHPPSGLVIDPICGMEIDPADAVGHLKRGGQTYHFCSDVCLERFRAEGSGAPPAPAAASGRDTREYTCPMDLEVRQVGPGSCPKCGMALEPVDAAPVSKTEWTCPMHPEVVRDSPGACPICGMALEPRVVTLEERNPELEDMTRRFWGSLALTVPILAFMISEVLPGQPPTCSALWPHWPQARSPSLSGSTATRWRSTTSRRP